MDNRLVDRIAVITGASSGLGKATAIRFANAGARLVCADLQSTGVEDEINKQHGADRAIFVKCDVTREIDVQNLIQRAVEFGGRLDIICNYAGIVGTSARIHEIPTEDFDKVMNINVRGVWLCCKHAVKQMLEQEPRQPNARAERTRGWIVNAASILGKVAIAQSSAYTTSKHAVVGLTKQMAVDYAEDRIHVNALCPGFVRSPMINEALSDEATGTWLQSLHPWKAFGRPEDVADAALFLCSDEAAWITGHSLLIDGGFTAW